jgi:hypothetical protein
MDGVKRSQLEAVPNPGREVPRLLIGRGLPQICARQEAEIREVNVHVPRYRFVQLRPNLAADKACGALQCRADRNSGKVIDRVLGG